MKKKGREKMIAFRKWVLSEWEKRGDFKHLGTGVEGGEVDGEHSGIMSKKVLE